MTIDEHKFNNTNLVTDEKSVIDFDFGKHIMDCTVIVLKFSDTFLFLFSNRMLALSAHVRY